MSEISSIHLHQFHGVINEQLLEMQREHEFETGSPLRINVDQTMANIFGCSWPVNRDEIRALCQLSDLAANVRHELANGDLDAAVLDLKIEGKSFIAEFVEWQA